MERIDFTNFDAAVSAHRYRLPAVCARSVNFAVSRLPPGVRLAALDDVARGRLASAATATLADM